MINSMSFLSQPVNKFVVNCWHSADCTTSTCPLSNVAVPRLFLTDFVPAQLDGIEQCADAA